MRRDKRFLVLDRLDRAGWGSTPFMRIPDEVVVAAERGDPVPQYRAPPQKIPPVRQPKLKPKPRPAGVIDPGKTRYTLRPAGKKYPTSGLVG